MWICIMGFIAGAVWWIQWWSKAYYRLSLILISLPLPTPPVFFPVLLFTSYICIKLAKNQIFTIPPLLYSPFDHHVTFLILHCRWKIILVNKQSHPNVCESVCCYSIAINGMVWFGLTQCEDAVTTWSWLFHIKAHSQVFYYSSSTANVCNV